MKRRAKLHFSGVTTLPLLQGKGKQDHLGLLAKPWAEGSSWQQHFSVSQRQGQVFLPCCTRGLVRTDTRLPTGLAAGLSSSSARKMALPPLRAPRRRRSACCLLKQRFLFPSGCSKTVLALFVTQPSETKSTKRSSTSHSSKEAKTTREAYREHRGRGAKSQKRERGLGQLGREPG